MKTSRKIAWKRVTNEYVVTFAIEGCPNCNGEGCIGNNDEGYTLCSCAMLNFRRQMVETGRVRQRSQRIGNRNVTWQEYRPLNTVAEVTNDH